MYRLWLTNFGWFTDHSFDTLEQAIAGAKTVGFEVSIYQGATLAASYSPLYGLKHWNY